MTFKDKINQLLKFKSDENSITSLYFKLGPEDRENFKYKITLKNLIREQKEKLNEEDLTEDALKSIESDIDKITEYFDTPDNLAELNGIALFSSSAAGLWEVFKLPWVYRNRLVIDKSPLVRQLVAIDNEFGDIVIAGVDRKKAKLFRISLNGVEEVADYFYPEATRNTKFQSQEGRYRQRVSMGGSGGEVAQGFGEYNFQRKIENEVHQHFKYVSEKLFDYYKKNKFDWLIVGGTDEATSEFSNHLHSYLQEKYLGAITMELGSVKPDELFERALDILESTERSNEERLIDEFETKLASGLAVNGLDDTLKALALSQVRILLVAGGFMHSGFICPESRVLVSEKNSSLCPEGSTPIPVVDVVDEAMEEALRQDAEIDVIFNEEVKDKIKGIGAILRFKI